MSEIRILIGLPGSGKTTYARYLEKYKGYVRLSQDEMVRIPNRLGMKQRIYKSITDCVEKGGNAVIDGTYIQKSQRRHIMGICKDLDAEVVLCVFSANVKDCIKHNEEKDDVNKPTEEIIRIMKDRLEKPTKKECGRIEKITDEWFEQHEEEVKAINEYDYERDIHREIIAARFRNS